MFDCKSVFPGLGPPRESNYYEDDCLVDSCDVLTRVSNQPPFNGQAARTIFAFGASELCRVISSLDSTGAVVIDIWDILAVRVLYFCSAKVPGTLDRSRILEAFHQGETQVPSLHQLCERLGVDTRDLGVPEARRRAYQVFAVVALAITYMAQHRRTFDSLCPVRMNVLLIHEWMARLARPKAASVGRSEGRQKIFESFSGRPSKRAATVNALFDTQAARSKPRSRQSIWHQAVCQRVWRGWGQFQQAWEAGANRGKPCTHLTSPISIATLAGQFDLLQRGWRSKSAPDQGSAALRAIDGNPFRGKSSDQQLNWQALHAKAFLVLPLPWNLAGGTPFQVPPLLHGVGFVLREPGLEAAQATTVRHRKVGNSQAAKRSEDAPRDAPEPNR